MKIAYVLPFTLVFIFLFFVLFFFQNTMSFVDNAVGVADWKHMTPVVRDIQYDRAGIVMVPVTNWAGNITLTDIKVREVSGDTDCEMKDDVRGQYVKHRERFAILAKCPYKTSGQLYSLLVSVSYKAMVNGTAIEGVEQGRITGHVGE